MTTDAHLTQPRDHGKFSHTTHRAGTIELERPLPLVEALDFSTLPAGDSRTIAHEVHGLEGIDTLTVKNLGPFPASAAVLFKEPGTGAVDATPANRVALTVTLPAEANLAELYEMDDWNRRGAREAAQHVIHDHLGLTPGPYNRPIPGLPSDSATLDEEGNLSVTFHESMHATAIDPEDLESWTEPYREFSEKESRWRLQEAIAESYNER